MIHYDGHLYRELIGQKGIHTEAPNANRMKSVVLEKREKLRSKVFNLLFVLFLVNLWGGSLGGYFRGEGWFGGTGR